MNKSHDIIVKVGVPIALVALLFSCHSPRMIKAKIRRSPVLELYSYIEYNREKELLLRMSSKSYIYYDKYSGVELGKWQRKDDSLFLYPRIHVDSDLGRCKIFDTLRDYRLYIYTDKNNITERTIEHFHLDDMFDGEDDWMLQEIHAPLTRRKIKATKIEKDVMMRRWLYGGSFFHFD